MQASTQAEKLSPNPVDELTELEPEPEPRLSDEDLWMLIRRFNKEIHHVKAVRHALPHELDLNRANEYYFSPAKLRTSIEWFYMSVVVGFANIWDHAWRLRSWKEHGRTAFFCAVYFIAWAGDMLIFMLTGTIAMMILFPDLQPLLFPPDAVDTDPGHVNHPEHDSLTGVPETHRGETAEHEATYLVRDIAEIALGSVRSAYNDNGDGRFDSDEDVEESSAHAHDLRRVNSIDKGDPETRELMMQKVSQAMVEVIRIIGDITDTYERFCNLFSPKPPFYLEGPRLRMVTVLLSAGFVSLLLSRYWIVKIGTFFIGFGFFGDPVMQRAVVYLNDQLPDWRKFLELKETLLEGVPTNAQLTLTLLRIGEMNLSPLPPPPGSHEPADPVTAKRHENPSTVAPVESLALVDLQAPFPNLLKLVRFTIGIGIGFRSGVEKAIVIARKPHSTPHMIWRLRKRGWVSAPGGPLRFKARFNHKNGTAVIDSSQEPPVLYFSTHSSTSTRLQDLRLESQHKGSVLFRVAIPDMTELKKTEKLGWKQKLILEMTGGIKYSVDGLIVLGCHPGQSFHLKAMRERDQLFNRLVAMGAQYWESR